MTEIKSFIHWVLTNVPDTIHEVAFDIGSDDGKFVNGRSQNRIKFTVVRKPQ